MDSRRITDLVQTITGLAVVLGLALVFWELQQSRDVATAQLTSDGFVQYSNVLAAQMGEALPLAIEKACEEPDSLSGRDLVSLNGYFSALIDTPLRFFRIEDRTGFFEGTWQGVGRVEFGIVFSTSAGRAWWRAQESQTWPTPLREFGNALLAQRTSRSGDCWIERWRAV